MEKFLLNFVNAFKESWFKQDYKTCHEVRGHYVFDDFRPLPYNIVAKLNLIEVDEYDEEKGEMIYSYAPNFLSI